MPRFFFHVVDGHVLPDEEGTELVDAAAARVEAVTVAGDMLREHARGFWNTGDWRVVVTDQDHTILFTLSCQALAAPIPAKRYDPRTRKGDA